ncbi:MAG: ATP-binding protein [Chloroflexota bacterium]|nr:ATP-binding protein [Chloroflexota bacterium]MDE2969637.1 ATP-binding protein [Chloroflexota bacterium]
MTMFSQDRSSDMPIDKETLETLLNMEEGPTLDFKREQYRFIGAADFDKSELLKDILAFANTHRYRTAYILIGVEEVTGDRSKVIGVRDHLEDASLHQFVTGKTNKPVEFSYQAYQIEDAEIGILSIPIQTRPVYALSKYGKVDPNTVYMRDGSSTGRASPDEIAAMGRDNPPPLIEWSINRLRNTAKNAIMTTAQQWQGHPARHREYGTDSKRPKYPEAREWMLGMVEGRHFNPTDYPAGLDSYGSLHWVFRGFEELGQYCTQTIRTIGPSLIQFGALMRAIVEMESCIDFERQVWEGFRLRMDDPNDPLPGEASYNLLSVAFRTVLFVDVLDDEDHYRDPDHSTLDPSHWPVFRQSEKWGAWR